MKLSGPAKRLRSKIWKTTAVLLLLAGLAGLNVSGSNVSPSNADGVPSTVASPQTLQPDAATYGISDSFGTLSQPVLSQRMADIRSAGALWVRYDLNWSAVQQHGPTSYDWSTSDRVSQAAVTHGLKVLMIIDLTPPFARVAGCSIGERCAPSNAAQYAAFAGKAAERYQTLGIHAYEIWNEPNISFRFGNGTDPVKYVAMLSQSYRTIKAADKNAFVVAASTAPAASEYGDLRPIDFLRQIYANGAQSYFDAISMHPYTYPITPSQSSPDDAWGQMITAHAVMAQNGDGDKKIWVTEFGAPTNGPNVPRDHVTENVQATTFTEAASQLKAFTWSGPLFWYGYQDAGTNTANSENFYGLVRADGSHKPAYGAFAAAARK